MVAIRYRLLQRLDFVVGFFFVWAVGMLIFWRLWGTCVPLVSPSPCLTHAHNEEMARGPITPVYIVEEHHEVLLYWFDAAERGLIKKQGNVLLHIDGHSDAAEPEDRNIIPHFRWPSLRDIYNMMQRNDVFIMAAGYTGLIKRYIWVWSPWDVQQDEPAPSDHHVIGLKLGTMTRTGLDGNMMEDICLCIESVTGEDDIPRVKNCIIASLTDPYGPESEIEIEKDKCKIKLDDAQVEVVSEAKAISLMKTGQWITPLDSVILDIDEDYYGCEPAVQPLYDVKVRESTIKWIKYYIQHIFCPTKPREEFEADKFYARLLDRIINLKQFCQQRFKATPICKSEAAMRKYIINQTDVIFEDILHRELWSVMCKSNTIVKKAIARLMHRVFTFTPEQLEAIKEVGICLSGSPRTLTYNPTDGMTTCDGYNRPNATVVRFHTPTAEEVTFRTSQLKVMLGSEGLHPGIVTVCRSMRDGYTPRKFFHKIEKDVLGVLKDVFETVDETTVFYDPYLLGGVYGWPGRHL